MPGRHGSEPSPTGPHSEEPDASTNVVPPPRGRFCTSCGAAAATDDHFCTACGAPLLKAEPPPASEPPATTPPALPGGGEAVESDAAGPDGPARSFLAEGYQGADGPAATRASVGPRADSRGRRSRLSRRRAIVGILTVVVLILSGTVAALSLTGTSAPTAVALEPLATPGANPFMPPVGIDQPGISPPQGSGGTFSGGTPGLYGGTLRQGSCDPRQMVDFLSAHPDKSAAWATVLGIRPADIAGYVASLAPVVLRSDVAVTNHGFTGGHVTSFPAVLQAGTAVLVDRYGSPVTKCFCGNPLTKPTAYSRPTYTGARWPSFAPGGITIVQQTTVTIDLFSLVDPATGASFNRLSGSTGNVDVGSGDVQATLLWSGDHDLDLHVTDPAGEDIYYRNKTSASGGQLDHDDRAGCGSAPQAHVENVFWPTGGATPGQYRVYVVLFSQCGGAAADYKLRVTVGGRVVYDAPGTLTTENQESAAFTVTTPTRQPRSVA